MNASLFEKKLNSGKPLILDGAMGTMLQHYGYTGNFPELLNIENPQLIAKIHLEYKMAGANILDCLFVMSILRRFGSLNHPSNGPFFSGSKWLGSLPSRFADCTAA